MNPPDHIANLYWLGEYEMEPESGGTVRPFAPLADVTFVQPDQNVHLGALLKGYRALSPDLRAATEAMLTVACFGQGWASPEEGLLDWLTEKTLAAALREALDETR